MTAARCAGVRISGSGCAALAGVKRLNQTLLISGRWRPEGQELVEVAGARGDLRCNGRVDRDARAGDVLKDAFIGGRFAALVVLRLQAVDGDDHVELPPPGPLGRDDTERAGDHLGMDAAAVELRQDLLKLAVANQGVAADQRNMERTVPVDKGENAPAPARRP